MQTITEQVLAAVALFEGYAKGFYCDYLGITRRQFDAVARRCLQRYDRQSYVTWYLPGSARYPS